MGHQIGAALCEALQLPKHTTSFVLRAEVGRIVTVECEYYPDGAEGITTALSEYELVRKPKARGSVDPCGNLSMSGAEHFDTWMRDRTDAAHAAYMARHSAGGVAYGQ